MHPLFRWPGGKRWLAPILRPLALRSDFDAYVEPFAGGGGAFFALEPPRARLSDVNSELMTAYSAVRDNPADVYQVLRSLPYNKARYYAVRDWNAVGEIETAARFLYLRQAAFGGIYRTNQAGQFNVPYGGRRRKAVLTLTEILAASKTLQGVDLRPASYEVALGSATSRSFVYADPPYAVAHRRDELFGRYTDRHFEWSDQEALAKLLRELVEEGAYVVASNADLACVRDLYPAKLFHRVRLFRQSRVARAPAHRGSVTEMLFVSRTIYRSPAAVQRIISRWQR